MDEAVCVARRRVYVNGIQSQSKQNARSIPAARGAEGTQRRHRSPGTWGIPTHFGSDRLRRHQQGPRHFSSIAPEFHAACRLRGSVDARLPGQRDPTNLQGAAAFERLGRLPPLRGMRAGARSPASGARQSLCCTPPAAPGTCCRQGSCGWHRRA